MAGKYLEIVVALFNEGNCDKCTEIKRGLCNGG